MGDYLKSLFGAQKPLASPSPIGDDGRLNHIEMVLGWA